MMCSQNSRKGRPIDIIHTCTQQPSPISHTVFLICARLFRCGNKVIVPQDYPSGFVLRTHLMYVQDYSLWFKKLKTALLMPIAVPFAAAVKGVDASYDFDTHFMHVTHPSGDGWLNKIICGIFGNVLANRRDFMDGQSFFGSQLLYGAVLERSWSHTIFFLFESCIINFSM